ncbi:MAG: GGDEF domain-containing protein [Candidatus Coatesbacteria bacterium]|nr:GGDEF domain-containing protein [Candidatus Coatesbacteria bacterium]
MFIFQNTISNNNLRKSVFLIYRLLVFLAGTYILFYSLINVPVNYSQNSVPTLLVFLAFAWIADRLYIVIYDKINIVYGIVIAFPAMMIFGPVWGIFIGSIASLLRRIFQRQFNTTTLFAFGERVILYSASAYVLKSFMNPDISFPYQESLTLDFLIILIFSVLTFKLIHLITSDLIFSFLSGTLNIKRIPKSFLGEMIVYICTLPLIILFIQVYKPDDFLSLLNAFFAVIITNFAIQAYAKNKQLEADFKKQQKQLEENYDKNMEKQNAYIERLIERQRSQLLEILEIGKVIRLNMPLDQLINIIILTMRGTFLLPHLCLYLQKERDKEFNLHCTSQKDSLLPETMEYENFIKIMKAEFRKNRLYVVPYEIIMRHFKEISREIPFSFLAFFPLSYGEEILGFLVTPLDGEGDDIYSQTEILQVFSEHIITAIINNREYERVRNNDPLTGLYNHRFFQEELERQIATNPDNVSLFMIDIDNFKNFNDTYGHPLGDEILKYLAKLLKKEVRDNDIVARYGGEEFSIILTRTNLLQARQIAERIIAAVNADKNLVYDEMPNGKVSLSIGLANYPNHANNNIELIEFADQALYAAKRAGRNSFKIFNSGKQE